MPSTEAYMPVVDELTPERIWIEPGLYKATCIAVLPPNMYVQYDRWYMRVDFALHRDGSIVSKCINLGKGVQPSIKLSPRTDYFKLWVQAAGRRPEKGEPMDPAKIKGVEFVAEVADQLHKVNGETYSIVKKISRS